MTEAKMTKREFVAEVRRWVSFNNDAGTAAADLAERAGVTWKPEQVEPRVGDLLTDDTRLMNDLGAVTSNNTIWQYYEPERLWYGCKGVGPRDTSSSMIRHGGRIVFVPGGSPAEPETCPTCSSPHPGVCEATEREIRAHQEAFDTDSEDNR